MSRARDIAGGKFANDLTVDNLSLDGNTISSTDTNGDITLDPNGTGKTCVQGGDDNYFFGVKGGTYGLRYNSNATSSQMMIEAVDDTLAASHEPLFIGGSTVSLGIAGSTKLHVNASGNVGIGASPAAKLHVQTSAVNSSIDNVADEFVIENNGASGMTILSANNDSGFILFGDPDYNAPAGIRYEHANDAFSFRTNSSWDRMRIDSSGTVLVGSTSFAEDGSTNSIKIHPHEILTGTTSTAANTHLGFSNPNGRVGSIVTNGSSTAFNTSSDYRLKEAVVDMTGAIDRVKALAPKRFNFIADADTTVDGFLAHEAQAVVPEAVTGTKDEVDDDGNAVMQGIDQAKLVPLLTGALKEAIAKIEALETEMTDLKARVAVMEAA